jgi:hypothetical protein
MLYRFIMKTRTKSYALVLLITGCVTLGSGGSAPDKEPPRPRLAEPTYLPTLARAMLRKRMERHGHDMPRLMLSVVLLQRDVAKELSQTIASEPRFVRPRPGDGADLNHALPERFFVLQEELRQRAKAVSEAAGKADDKALGEAFGQMTQTCVACHSAYLNP